MGDYFHFLICVCGFFSLMEKYSFIERFACKALVIKKFGHDFIFS